MVRPAVESQKKIGETSSASAAHQSEPALFPAAPGPVAFPDPFRVAEMQGKLRYINLKMLIELKLSAHRYQDFADVVNLIRANNLDESFMSQLHSSVHQDFVECL